MAEMTPGQLWIQGLEDEGYSDEDIAVLRANRDAQARAKGFTQNAMDAYWGVPPTDPAKVTGSVMEQSIKEAGGWKYDQLDPADGILENLAAGFGMSAFSLSNLGQRPDKRVPDPADQSFLEAGASMLGQVVGDFPAMVTGATAAGLATKNPLLTGYAAMALPEAIRQAILEDMENGTASDWREVLERASRIIQKANTAGVIGGAANKAGALTRGFTGKSGRLVANTTEAAAAGAGGLVAQAALEGRIPTTNEVILGMGAMMVPGAAHVGEPLLRLAGARGRIEVTKAGEIVKKNMERIWAKTGINPKDLGEAAAADRVVKQNLMSVDDEGRPITVGMEDIMPPEPPPRDPVVEVDPVTGKPAPADGTGGFKFDERPASELGRVFDIIGKDGEPVARLVFSVDAQGTAIIRSLDAGKPGVFGTAAMRQIRNAFVKQFPGIKKIVGYRRTGARMTDGEAILAEQEVKPVTAEGTLNPETGLAKTSGLDGDTLARITGKETDFSVDFDAVVKKHTEDGVTDTEAAVIEANEGATAAMIFKANGRNYMRLKPSTQRALEIAGERISYNDPETEAGKGGGGGKKPPDDQKALGGPDPKLPKKRAPKDPRDPSFKRDPEFIRDDINAVVNYDKVGRTWADTYRQWKQGWRELAIFGELDRRWELQKTKSDIGLEDMFRLVYSAVGRSTIRVKRGGFNITVRDDGVPMYKFNSDIPGYEAVWRGAEKGVNKLKGGREDLRAFLQAKDTIDRDRLGLKTVVDPVDATDYINGLDKETRQKMENLAEMNRKVFENSLQGLVEAGALSPEGKRAAIEKHPNWFPQVVAGTEPAYRPGSLRSIRKPLKKATGHAAMLKDQIIEAANAIFQRDRIASVNLARRAAVLAVRQHVLGENVNAKGLMVVENKRPGTDVALKDGGYKKAEIFDDNGNMVDWEKTEFFQRNENVIRYLDNGRMVEFQVPDFPGREAFMDAVNGAGVEQAATVRVLSAFAQLKRSGITSLPSFVTRVMLLDSAQASVFNKGGGYPVLNLFSAFAKAIHHWGEHAARRKGAPTEGSGDAMWIEATLNGMYNMSLGDMDSANYVKNLHRLHTETGHIGALVNTVKDPLEALRMMMRQSDATVRIGVTYKSSVKEHGPIRAAMRGRVLHGDFMERSRDLLVNQMHSIVTFMRAGQRAGWDSLSAAMREDAPGIILRGLAKLTMPALFFEVYAQMTEQFVSEEDLPIRRDMIDDRIKDTNFVFPWMMPNGEWIQMKIPLPPGLGIVFGGWVHRAVRHVRDNDPRAWNEYLENVWWDFANALPIPAAFEPVLGHITNHEFFTGGKWTPARLEKASGPHQYQPWTTETAKNISRLINAAGGSISPITIEGYAKGWGGGLAIEIMEALDYTQDYNVQPRDIANTPWVGSFVVRNPGMSAQIVDSFYDEFEKFEKAKANVRILEKRGDEEGLEAAAEDPMLAVDLAPAAEALADMRAAAYAIMESKFENETNPDGSPLTTDQIKTEKRQLLDDIFAQMMEVAQSALDALDEHRAETVEDNAEE